jgi:PEP-CTERM motif
MRRITYGAMLAIACLGLCTTSAWADLIGINFQGRTDATHSSDALAPGDVAGVMPQNNWNNDPTLVSGGTHTLNQLMDSTGTHTSVSLSVSAVDSWFSGSGNADPNHALLNGIIKANATPATYTFNNLTPGGTYTLIAYTVENAGRANNNLTIGTTKYFTTAQDGTEFNGTFVRAMNTNPTGTRDVGNYVEFDNVTADSSGRLMLTDAWTTGTDGVGIAGIQLQSAGAAIPEPASVVLFGLGTLALISVARRRAP